MSPPLSLFRLPLRFLRAATRALAAALLAAASAHALTWETTERALALDAGSAEVVVEFPFKNASRSTVIFTGVKSGCDCTVPDLPDQPVPPGGKGVLKVHYHPGNLPGEKNVPVEVLTDEAGQSPAVLRIKAVVSPVLSITPALLRWTRHAEATPRTVVIRGAENRKITALTLTTTPATLTASLTPGKEPNTWTLALTPVSTRDELTARVQLQAEVDGHTLALSVYAIVR